jgi:hypothetical protein
MHASTVKHCQLITVRFSAWTCIYVIERLPIGIEECRFINLTSDEGYSKSHFQAIIPLKGKEIVTV